ncbi:MAG: GTP-binding protein [Candidatus Micrarchaeota archaeon]
MGVSEKIKEIEDEMKRTKVNKATESHLGLLKAKLAKLRREFIKISSKKAGGGGGFGIRKSGDATVVLIGPPSVGKSTLLNRITNADSRIAQYLFTTLTVVPGLMTYNGAKIQVLDLPGIVAGASEGKGRGKEVLSVSRSADLVLIMLDVFDTKNRFVYKELEAIGMRLDQKPPNVVITLKKKGGVEISSTVNLTKITPKTVNNILSVYGIHNADIVFRENINTDQFIDAIVGNRRYVPSLLTVNKVDLVKKEYLKKIKSELSEFIPISAENNINMGKLKKAIYEKLELIRVYTKPRMGEADMEEPLMIQRGFTIQDVISKLRVKGMEEGFKHASIWGESAKFGGQKVGLKHILKDGDIIQITSR